LTAILVSQVENCAAPLNCPKVSECVNVRLLHDVFGFLVITQDRSGRAVDPVVVAAHQQLEYGGVALEHLPDNVGVGLFGILEFNRGTRFRHRGDHSSL
jgi:hypothetical protein